MRRAVLVSLLLARCAPAPAPEPALALAPAPALAPASAPAPAVASRAPPPPGTWPGMYVASKNGEDRGWWFFAPRPGGAWLLSPRAPDRANRVAKVTLAARDDGWSVQPGIGDATVSLSRPARDGDPWRLVFPEGSAPQRLDAETTRLAARLSKGIRLVRLDDRTAMTSSRIEDAYTKDAIDVQDGLFTRLEIARHDDVACYFDVLLPLLFHERGERPAAHRSPPVASDLHAVSYMLAKTQLSCPGAFDPDGDYESTELGQDAGVTFYVRNGEPLGAVVVSYMYAGLFVAPGVTRADVAAMGRVADAARAEQAE